MDAMDLSDATKIGSRQGKVMEEKQLTVTLFLGYFY